MSNARKLKKRIKQQTGMTPQQIAEKRYVDVFNIIRDAMLETVQMTMSGDMEKLPDAAQTATEKVLDL